MRVDSALVAGLEVGGRLRPDAREDHRLGADRARRSPACDGALGETVVLGVGTNLDFLRALLDDPDVRAGRLDTGLIERRLDGLVGTGALPDAAALAALPTFAIERAACHLRRAVGRAAGWRIGAQAPARFASGRSTAARPRWCS